MLVSNFKVEKSEGTAGDELTVNSDSQQSWFWNLDDVFYVVDMSLQKSSHVFEFKQNAET